MPEFALKQLRKKIENRFGDSGIEQALETKTPFWKMFRPSRT